MSRRARRTSTRTGRSSIRRSGCPTATPACASTRAAAAARRASSTTSRRARPRTSPTCIEWAGVQPWSNGKVGLNGISYYAMNQWQVAALQPAAPGGDVRVGGRVRLVSRLHPPRRHPLARSGPTGTTCRSRPSSTASASAGRASRDTGDAGVRRRDAGRGASWHATASDFGAEILAHPLDDDYHRERSARLGQDHRAAAVRRQLGRPGAAPARQRRGLRARRRRRTSGSRCTASSTGRTSTPTTAWPCRSASSATSSRARTPAGRTSRRSCCRSATPTGPSPSAPRSEWPLARTRWTQLYLDLDNGTLDGNEPAGDAVKSFEALGDGLTFTTAAARAARPRSPGRRRASSVVSSSTTDADIFARRARVRPRRARRSPSRAPSTRTRRSPRAGCAPRTASSTRSAAQPYRPYHTHDEEQTLQPGESTSSTSRSGRPRSSSRPATASP